MKQTLVILRGAAGSGKTTLSEKLRNYDKKIVWLSIDKMKVIFSNFEDRTLEDTNKASIAQLRYLLGREYSVVYEGIFKNTDYVYQAVKIAKNRNIPVTVYQLKCSLNTLKNRDKTREGVREGYRKPLGDELIGSIYRTNISNPLIGAIELDTENKSLEECLEIIRKDFD